MVKNGIQILASLEGNHRGEPELLRRLIETARTAGADGVVLQKRTASQAAVRQVLDRPVASYRSLGTAYRKALEKLELPLEQWTRLCADLQSQGFRLVVAPYDLPALRQVQGLPVAGWKVSAPLATHLPLLEAMGALRQPIAASVSGCTEREVKDLLGRLPPETTLVHDLTMCDSSIDFQDVGYLAALKPFGRTLGYADRSPEAALSLLAVTLGATLIEKPLLLERSSNGADHAAGLSPQEFSAFVREIRAFESILDSRTFRNPDPHEMDRLDWERVSIVAARSIPKGTLLTREMLAFKPPFRSLSPALAPFLEGRKVLYDIPEDTFLTLGMVEL